MIESSQFTIRQVNISTDIGIYQITIPALSNRYVIQQVLKSYHVHRIKKIEVRTSFDYNVHKKYRKEIPRTPGTYSAACVKNNSFTRYHFLHYQLYSRPTYEQSFHRLDSK